MLRRNDISKVLVIGSVLVLASALSFAATPTLKIKLKSNATREQQEKEQVERLAAQYDLKKYTKTRDIIIEEGAMAHAYPKLTMNCRFLNDDDLALSQYVHEQGHWVLQAGRRPNNPILFNDLQRLAPGLPIEYPAGGGDLRSTYFHIPVIMLEWLALEDLIGVERAQNVMEWKKSDHYTAIYPFVLEHRSDVEQLMKRHGIHW